VAQRTAGIGAQQAFSRGGARVSNAPTAGILGKASYGNVRTDRSGVRQRAIGSAGKRSSPAWPSASEFRLSAGRLRSNFVAAGTPGTEDHGQRAGKPENIGQKFRAGNKQIGRAVHRIGETEMPRNRLLLAAVIGVLITVSAGGGAFAQKSGGISEYTAPTARRA
jgi:hypothetical protein